MLRTIGRAVLILAVTALTGCGTSRTLTTRGQLMAAGTTPITVYSEDRHVYTLRQHVVEDSVITGAGTVRRGDERSAFQGSIPLTSIRAVKTNSKNVMKGLALLGVTALFVEALAEGNGHSGGLRALEDKPLVYPYSGGGGGESCPYVYSWNGERYVLEAEPFGVALGKGLELTTTHLLPSARAEKRVIRVRMTNERRETHYVNSLSLYAIDLGDAPAAVLDGRGIAWPLRHAMAPVAAHDAQGHSILGAVARTDGRMWECDASRLLPGSGYEDVVELAFAVPRSAAEGTLVLTGINTSLSTAIYGHLVRAAGDPVTIAHAIDGDPELIARLRDYLADASLKASVWNGREWEPAGSFQPEANAVTFTRALRIRLPGGAGDTVRVRLRSMADVWKIDALAADWTEAAPLTMEPMTLLRAAGPDGEDLSDALRGDDDRYAILVPPDRVELAYEARSRAPGNRVVYAVAGRGYLHEWTPEGVAENASWAPDEGRLALLKELLKHRDLALRPVYEEWRSAR
ncbi:MAG TPA: hypothetical protein VFM00_03735 [Candidatus Eisenbacteria bacterium]|nr:hypothetical protein [Candidatus Eisenbacteria bacterium]